MKSTLSCQRSTSTPQEEMGFADVLYVARYCIRKMYLSRAMQIGKAAEVIVIDGA